MRIVVTGDVGAIAAQWIARAIDRVDAPTIGLATGSSPVPVYRELGRLILGGALSLSSARAFALDEYVDLPRDHPQSYAVVVSAIASELGLDMNRVWVPDGLAVDLAAACRDFEARILEAGGVDVQILGIGANGHVGFNEPSSSLASRTRVVALADSTISANSRFFENAGEVPRSAVTQGLGTILEARSIVLVASGSGKAAAVAEAIEGPVSSSCPASVLQLHNDVTFVLDPEAASRLTRTDYYRRNSQLVTPGSRLQAE